MPTPSIPIASQARRSGEIRPWLPSIVSTVSKRPVALRWLLSEMHYYTLSVIFRVQAFLSVRIASISITEVKSYVSIESTILVCDLPIFIRSSSSATVCRLGCAVDILLLSLLLTGEVAKGEKGRAKSQKSKVLLFRYLYQLTYFSSSSSSTAEANISPKSVRASTETAVS